MIACVAGKLCLLSVLLTVPLIAQAQISQWYVAGNITFSTRVLNGRSEAVDSEPKLEVNHRRSLWTSYNQEPIDKSRDVNHVPQEKTGWQENSRSNQHVNDAVEPSWTSKEFSEDVSKAESKEEKEKFRKKEKKLLKKLAVPLLMIYKIKFLMLIPVLVTALVLLSGSSGLAGFFFALFATMIAHGKEH